jgi:mannitol/fructose-specific phosphotransferase system IIA component (Ntr-type)
MAVGTTRQPVDFDSLDGVPVRLIWMIAGPERTAGLHVRTLAAISELLRTGDVRRELMDVDSPQEFIRRVKGAESNGG